jgi:hypothetical protein
MKTLVDQSKQTYEQFKKDKKSKLPYNEGQVHKYDKIKLNEMLHKKALVQFDKHCFPQAQKAVADFRAWHCNTYKKYLDDIQHIDKDLGKLRTLTKELISSVSKNKPSSALPGSRAPVESSGKDKEKADTLTGLPDSSGYFSVFAQTDSKQLTNLHRIVRVQHNVLDLTSEIKTMIADLGERFSAVESSFSLKVQHLQPSSYH